MFNKVISQETLIGEWNNKGECLYSQTTNYKIQACYSGIMNMFIYTNLN